jgi:hypothetical protein
LYKGANQSQHGANKEVTSTIAVYATTQALSRRSLSPSTAAESNFGASGIRASSDLQFGNFVIKAHPRQSFSREQQRAGVQRCNRATVDSKWSSGGVCRRGKSGRVHKVAAAG